jgi:hypothetical protein
MKNISYTLLILCALVSCNKIEIDQISFHEDLQHVDTTIYPGNWLDYYNNEWPTFEPEFEQDRNALIEVYTGHQCSTCPEALAEAHNLNQSQAHIYYSQIHASPTTSGENNYQALNSEYTFDFRNETAQTYGSYFSSLGFNDMPQGNLSRKYFGIINSSFMEASNWTNYIINVLAFNQSVGIQAESNYFEVANGGFIHVHVDFESMQNTNYMLVAQIIKKEEYSNQNQNDVLVPNFLHRNLLIGTLDNKPWGHELKRINSGAYVQYNRFYSFTVPQNHNINEYRFFFYVYRKNDIYKEILQVISHEF